MTTLATWGIMCMLIIKNCDLCILEKKTKWYYEDKDVVVCDCIICRIPQVILRSEHSMNPSQEIQDKMERVLLEVSKEFYGEGVEFYIDKNQRKIPDHLHWHARKR